MPQLSLRDLSINVVNSPDKVSEFWDWLTRPRDFIAADTETTGLNPHAPGFKVRLLQFGDCESGWAIPFQEWKGLAAGAFSWLERMGMPTVWHNLAADEGFLQAEGIKLNPAFQEDTYVWASLCGFAEESRALKTISTREFGRQAKFGQQLLHTAMKNAGWTWETVPIDFKPYVQYGVVDPIITAMYRRELGDSVERFRWHHSLEIATIELTNQMARNGLGVSTTYAADEVDKLEAEEAAVLAELRTHGIESANQNVKVAKVLADAGVLPEIVKLTASGQIAVDKEFLNTVKHPVAKLVLQARAIHKTKGYLESMIKFAGGNISDWELIHPEIRSIEARTSRMSVANPALQQLPAVDDKNPDSIRVRKAIRPRNPDELLVGADFGQIELRMFASMSRDTKLMEVINTMDAAKAAGDKNADFFVVLGRDLYEPTFVKSDPRRTKLKSTIYALLYGGGEEKIAETAKVPQAEIHQTIMDLKSRYPSFNDLGESAIRESGGTWTVETPTGRQFRVRRRDERRKLNNYRVQGASAEILKMAITNVAEAGWGQSLMLPVHDEIIMSVPRDKARQATSDLIEAMNAVIDPDKFGVAVKAAAAEPAPNWGVLSH